MSAPRVSAVASKRSRCFFPKPSVGVRLQLKTNALYLYDFDWSDTANGCIVVRCTQNTHRDMAAALSGTRGEGVAGQWLERRARDWEVAGSNPCRSGRRVFFHKVNFLCWLLFRHPFLPRLTAVARKRTRSFCQKCRWQVTAKYACNLRKWLCTKWHVACLYGVHRPRLDSISFMWHQRCKYTTSVAIQKRGIKS